MQKNLASQTQLFNLAPRWSLWPVETRQKRMAEMARFQITKRDLFRNLLRLWRNFLRWTARACVGIRSKVNQEFQKLQALAGISHTWDDWRLALKHLETTKRWRGSRIWRSQIGHLAQFETATFYSPSPATDMPEPTASSHSRTWPTQ